ncbi:MAG TPA: DUF4837 family protein [Flavobacteriales bacterium]|nr:DUF4837 family protein [Flavobacteriales bacterium]
MAKHIVFIFTVLMITLSSCEEGTNYKMTSGGAPGEVIVVVDDELWKSHTLGDTIRWFLEDIVPGLPQQEYMFNIGQYDPDRFSRVMRSHRNIILFEISQKVKNPRAEYLRDSWAANQIVIKLHAPDAEAATALFVAESNKIVSLLNSTERERLIKRHKNENSGSIEATLKDKHNILMNIPVDFRLAEDKGNFIWLARDRIRYVSGEAHDVDEGIFIYYYPYTNDSTFSSDFLLRVRDSVCKANVPGPSEGSYMSTERDSMYYPIFTATTHNKKYAAEIRGLYRTVNDFYGGPFISLTTLDEARNRIVTVDCFVFAPKFHKREYLREMEAICYSLNFP